MVTLVAEWPPPAAEYLEMPAAPVGRASAEASARYRIASPCCGCGVTVPLGQVRQMARWGRFGLEPVWVQCGRTFNLRKGRTGCDADRAFDPVFAADGTLTAVRWRTPQPAQRAARA